MDSEDLAYRMLEMEGIDIYNGREKLYDQQYLYSIRGCNNMGTDFSDKNDEDFSDDIPELELTKDD